MGGAVSTEFWLMLGVYALALVWVAIFYERRLKEQDSQLRFWKDLYFNNVPEEDWLFSPSKWPGIRHEV